MNEHEIERIAAAMNQARPDWPLRQLTTLLGDQRICDRPRRDVFVALAWVASEPASSSPYRVLEAGPWWKAAGIEGTATKRPEPDNHERCSACSVAKDRCRSLYTDDHDFRPWTDRPQIDTAATVAALKGFIEPTARPPDPKPLLPTDRDPAAIAAREHVSDERNAS